MKETERRIKIYRARLPKIREKIIASLLIFAVSAATMAVATFSWITLSVSPEVAGMTTTIAANGNLEIALANQVINGKVVEPGESEIGDSNIEKLIDRNQTWGNLVNLSDPDYGLENLVLYPASLNKDSLNRSPLYGPLYDADGRVIKLHTSFGYTSWNKTKFEQPSTPTRGVRAVSALVKGESGETAGAKAQADAKASAIEESNLKLNSKYIEIAKNDVYMDVLGKLMVGYMAARIKSPESNSQQMIKDGIQYISLSYLDMYNLKQIYIQLVDCFDDLAQIYADYFNLMIEIDPKLYGKEKITADEILKLPYTESVTEKTLDTTMNAILKSGSKDTAYGQLVDRFPGYEQNSILRDIELFLKDYNTLKEDIDNLQLLINAKYPSGSGSVSWPNITATKEDGTEITVSWILDRLTIAGDCIIVDPDGARHYVKGIGGSIALGLKGKTVDAIITNGILRNFENRCGARIETETKRTGNDPVKLTIGIQGSIAQAVAGGKSVNVYAYIFTDANSNYVTTSTTAAYEIINEMEGALATVAAETYGLVIDLWARTNNEGSYLVLEGDVIYSDPIDVLENITYTLEDGTNKTVETQIYLVDVTTKNTTTPADGSDPTVDSTTNTVEVYYRTKADGTEDTNTMYRVDAPDAVFTVPENPADRTDENGTTYKTEYSSGKVRKKTRVEVIGYSGINRIWNNGDADATLIDPTISTTQGSGSCYTFYADTPEDMEQILAILSTMKIAFIDGTKGEFLAEAELATDLHFAEAGKVVVPIQLIKNNDSTTGIKDLDNEPVYAITKLQRNVPLQISAIVYLDGDQTTNSMAFAFSSVQGSMNIQFGTYTSPDAISDDILEAETRTISATFTADGSDGALSENNTRIDFRENVDNALEFDVALELKIEGTEAKQKIEAYFIRKINATQGTRLKTPATIDKGTLKGTFTFNTPGEYILRSVFIDGVEYNLTNMLTVKIPGIGISALSGTEGASYTHLTSNNTYSETFTIMIATDRGIPGSVKGVFMNEDGGSITTVYSQSPGDSSTYTANITFINSGKYTMQYVVIDDVYYDVNIYGLSPLVRDINMGMKASVYIETADDYIYEEGLKVDLSNHSIRYKYADNEDGSSRSHNFNVGVEIMNNAGVKLTNLTNVTLHYAGIEGGTGHALRWSTEAGLSGRYTGGLLIEEDGKYTFSHLTVEANGETHVITSAVTATSITVLPTSPVEYLGRGGKDDNGNFTNRYVVIGTDTTKDAKMTLMFNYAKSADVYGLFERDLNGAKSYYILEATRQSTNANYYDFIFPDVDGYWTLLDVRMNNVFYNGSTIEVEEDSSDAIKAWTGSDSTSGYYTNKTDAQNAFDKNNQYYSGVRDTNGEWTQIKTINSVNQNNATFTPTYENNFMEKMYLGEFSVALTDFEGQAIPEISNVYISAAHVPNTMNTYYTTTNDAINSGLANGQRYGLKLTHNEGTVTYTYAASSSNGTNKDQVWFAGTYNLTLYYQVNGVSVGQYYNGTDFTGADNTINLLDSSGNAAKFVVKTTLPTVKVTATDPSPGNTFPVNSHSAAATGGGFTELKGVTNSFTDYSATVFIKYTGSIGIGSLQWRGYQVPTVELTLSGMTTENFEATMTFKHQTKEEYSATYTFKQDALVQKQSIGHADDAAIADGNPAIYFAGKQTVSAMTVTYGGVEYTVPLSHTVTINQPQYPYKATYSINHDTYTGMAPATICGAPGETFDVVLHKIQWHQTGIESGSNTTYGNWSATTIHTDYGYKESGWIIKTREYQPYHWTKLTRTVSGEQRTWTTTYSVTKWVVNGQEYVVDYSKDTQTISVPANGNIQVTAVVESSTSYGEWSNTSTTQTMYGYVKGSTTSTKPGGKKIGNTISSGSYPEPSLGLASYTNGQAATANMYAEADAYLNCANRAS